MKEGVEGYYRVEEKLRGDEKSSVEKGRTEGRGNEGVGQLIVCIPIKSTLSCYLQLRPHIFKLLNSILWRVFYD